MSFHFHLTPLSKWHYMVRGSGRACWVVSQSDLTCFIFGEFMSQRKESWRLTSEVRSPVALYAPGEMGWHKLEWHSSVKCHEIKLQNIQSRKRSERCREPCWHPYEHFGSVVRDVCVCSCACWRTCRSLRTLQGLCAWELILH